MRCNNCGSENRDDAKFCRRCGAPLTKQKSRRPILIVALITVFAVSVTVAVMLLLHISPIPNDAKPVDKGAARGSILVLEDKIEPLRNEDDGRSIIAAHQEDLGVGNVADMLGNCRIETIGDNKFYRYSLEVDGIPIYGRSVVLAADRDEMLCAITSGAVDMGDCQTVPAIDDLEARDALAKETGISSVYASDLVFYCDDGTSPTLAYELAYIDGVDAGRFFISASDGSVMGQSPSVHALQGDGKDIHATNRSFEVASRLEVSDRGDDIPATSQGFYALVDLSRNLYVYDANGDDFDKVLAPMEVSTKSTRYHLLPAKTEPGYTWQDDQENEVAVVGHFGKSDSWVVRKADGSEEQVEQVSFSYADHLVTSTTTTIDAPAAVTLMASLSSIYDFYASEDTFRHVGFDGSGGRVNAVCGVTLNNACAWAPAGLYAQVVCGKDHDYLAHVVIAHEYAHTVQGSICDLSGIGESGSIKEGTSDVLGILACDYADNGEMDNSASWKLSVRDLINPESMGNPSSYRQEGLWADTIPQYDSSHRHSTNDYGNIHQNSTVLSHAAYLMCDRKTEIGGQALTTMELGNLVMGSFQLVSNPDCDFAEFAGYMNCIARENLSQDKKTRVEKAFEAVGIEPWLVAFIDSRDTPPDNDVRSTDNEVSRKLATSFHMTYSSKKWSDQAYEEWVDAAYDEQGNITHKEITRETSFNGWEGEPAYSLDFEYDAAGDLLHVTGVESPGASYSTQVNWNFGYEEGNATLRASGTEGSDSRYVNDTYDADGNLVARDYLIRTGQVLENGTLTLSYDAFGRVSGQSATKGYNGDQSSMSRYDMSVTYDGSSRIASIEVLDSSGKQFSRRTYEYDEAGRLTSRNHFYDGGSSNLTVKQSYSYDESGHLSSIDQTEGDGWWAPAKATFTTDEDGSIVTARIEGEDYIRTYEVEYVTISTPRGQEPFNAVDLTNPVNPELYNELWVSHANLDPTPYDESAFLRENRRWLELHDPSEFAQESTSESTGNGKADSKGDSTSKSTDAVEASAARYEFDGKQYWVVFKEGFRNGRVEASSFNVSSGSPTLVWDENVTVSGATVDGKVSQFRLREDGEWEKIGEYGIPTDWALEILASNVPIVDSSGNRLNVPDAY